MSNHSALPWHKDYLDMDHANVPAIFDANGDYVLHIDGNSFAEGDIDLILKTVNGVSA